MQVDPKTRAKARLVLTQAARDYYLDPNVSMIDFGYPEQAGIINDSSLAIRFHVHKKLDEPFLELAEAIGETTRIPEHLDGFETDVQERTYTHHLWTVSRGNPYLTRSSSLQGGLSISSECIYGAGTLGGLVVDNQTRVPMILSNWHVLVGRWSVSPGQPILQPGLLDGGSEQDVIASLTRDGMSSFLDAAVATIDGNARQLMNSEIGLGSVSGLEVAHLGMQVVKSGRTSGITYGCVTGVDGHLTMSYDGIERVIQDVISIDPLDDMSLVSEAGDSGSFWCERDTMRAVALHFAGTNQPERALALDMIAVFDALDISLFNG